MNTTTQLTDTLAHIVTAHAERAATARQKLADYLSDGTAATDLTVYFHQVITDETTAKVYADTLGMLTHGATTDTARDYLTARVLQSPGDTWSGRTNDAERVKADAVRTAVRDLLHTLAD